jgi:AcrR family transcriptional regulator
VIHFFAGATPGSQSRRPYRPTEKTEARKAATRERIVAAALDQLAEGGYASASVQAVAARAGVATGSVYRYFPSKSELFAEVFRRASAREMRHFAEATAGAELPAEERIAAAVESFARRALAGPVRAYALIAEPVDPAVEAERMTFRRAYADLFARALRELPHPHPDLAAAAIVGALAEALLGPLARHDTDAGALTAGLQDFVLGATHAAQPV